MTDLKNYWEEIYSENEPSEVSWHQDRPDLSLNFIREAGTRKTQWIIDVGGGASTLVDHLISDGFKNLAVLDISAAALERTKARLNTRATAVEWIESDVKTLQPRQHFALWHDRAVFHFLTEEADRQAYVRTLRKALVPGGHLIVATFSTGGPKQCSGLPIVQYEPAGLSQVFGDAFELRATKTESHRTPWNAEQKFVYCMFQLKH